VGFASTQNLTVTDIRKPEYIRDTQAFNLSIVEVAGALYQHNINCRPIAPFIVNPLDTSSASITMTTPGFTQDSVLLYIEFKQSGSKTQAVAYAYYSTWSRIINEIFYAVEKPDKCQ